MKTSLKLSLSAAALLAAPLAGAALPTDLAPYFDANSAPSNGYNVVGAYTPPSWSWGQIELLEGKQLFRSEYYNRRTEKLRDQDTYQSSEYPVRTYYGSLNQQLVNGFNLYYKNSCATTAGSTCPVPGPTRPEARFVLLHKGRKTAARTCNVNLTPTLLVHGAMQDGNVWLFPNGNDGTGSAYGGASQVTGFVQDLEAKGRCVYAVTFGNFHGDNFSQATHVANAVSRIKALHPGVPRVDVVAWSKGVLAADAWLTNAPSWTGFSTTRFFERMAAEQARAVPAYNDTVRVYVALSGPHRGIDLNFRHPIHTLTIASTSSNAPVGRGPMPWTYFSAFQCVNWGPDVPWYNNPYAESVCEGSGGTWPDYFRRIYVSNITSLDSTGKPVTGGTLKTMNVNQGVSSSSFNFDEYNMSMFGSVNDSGRYVNAYVGQLQAADDLRGTYAIPDRDTYEWSDVDQDEARYFPWVDQKLVYLAGGYLDSDHTQCKATAFDPVGSPCFAYHVQYAPGYETYAFGYYKYRIIQGLGIAAAKEMGGKFITRLSQRSLDSRLPSLYVLYGTTYGASTDARYETDGMACSTCSVNGDGVLFNASIAAMDQLTQHWTSTKKTASAKQEGMPYGHLEMGVTPAVWSKMSDHFASRD
ncbi:alpha/beta hydrolase [Archangium violaceum]|uniref:esterase/lipase family protein n=1 Tax=Archangium violaceum TaxID=83451 RepID=UPI00193AE4E9|nr:alpha/beta hydrolase [Archangium violaceum]QRK10684.1 alpha/beta hydrolase [Archangium violaceum]